MDDHREHGQRGRGRRNDSGKERLWRQRLDGQKESGLSIRAYCRQEGIGEPLFYWWRCEIARRGARGVAKSQRKKPGAAIRGSQPSFAEVLPARQCATAPAATGRPELSCAPRRARRPQSSSLSDATASGALVSSRADDARASLRSALLQPVACSSNAIEIVLRGGRVLRVRAGFDPNLLLEVARMLEDEVSAC